MKRILLILSAIAFFCLQITTKLFAIGVMVSVPFLVYFSHKWPDLAAPRKMSIIGKIFCALTATGICLWPLDNFAGWLQSITVFQRFQSFLGVEMVLFSQIAAIMFAVAGWLFVYQMICLYFERFFAIARHIVQDFTKEEGITALVAAGLLMAAVVIIYSKTNAFASPVVMRDLIYTSDSGAIVHENVYLSLSALENDFRSPLFALFAAPLLGLPYLLSRILPIPNALAVTLVAAQVPLLVASFCLLMKMIRGVSKTARILLPVMMLTTYSSLLFTVMAEQYIVALFYLSLCLYSLVVYEKRDQILLLGAAGTMIPGAVLALIPKHQGKKATDVLTDALQTGLWGFILLCTLGGLGVLLRIPQTLHSIGRFTGVGITFQAKILQFLAFVGQIFFAPMAGESSAADGYAKWRLTETGGISILGIVILVLACIGFALNRKQTFAKISMLWVTMSVLVLCVMGWGTAENGLTLYTLYFGWAYAALLVYLIESICKAIRLERFSWIVYALGAAALLWYNLPHLQEMLLFAAAQYPLQGRVS